MRFVAWLFGVLLFCGPAWAGTMEDTFVAASDAYKSHNERALATDAQRLHAENYTLAPYADYWLLLLRLDQASPSELQDFLARYNDMPLSDQLRAEWLKQLGKRQDWPTFFSELPRIAKQDAVISCYALLGRDAQGDGGALRDGKTLWMTPTDQPGNCDTLFDRMQQQGILDSEDIWARARLTLTQDRLSVAKAILRRLPQADVGNFKLLDNVYDNPQRVLEKKQISSRIRYGRELILYAIERLSRSQPQLALDFWNDVKSGFGREDQAYVWGRIAFYAAKRHDPEALEWFGHIDDAQLTQEQLTWKARAALRVRNWDALLITVAAMPEAAQGESVWRYWKGRALKEKGQTAAANAVLLPLSRERETYYGLLAEEELGAVMGTPSTPYKASDEDVRAVQSIPGIQRATALYQMDMRWEARNEWLAVTRNFDDKHLIAAAELAFRQEWYDLAISTADKTSLIHDFTLRYPTPYRDLMQGYARDNGLDEAWVYGLIRQESRFLSYARSGVGATGIMQVMPATAKWIAKRMGVRNYHPSMIGRLDTNLQFGTFYLRHILDKAGGQPLVATAAYNAGPSRAKRWSGNVPLEGAIYAETIPFVETRGYVQKVLSNACFYANRLGGKLQSLKQRLGQVSGDMDAMTPKDGEPE